MKKINVLISVLVSTVILLSSVTAFAAPDMDLEYVYSSDFAAIVDTKENGVWSYKYNADITTNDDETFKKYDNYIDMIPDGTRWEGTSGSNTKGRFTNGDIAIYPNGRIAAIWTAPMSGIIKINPGDGLGRTHSSYDPTKNLQSIYVRIVIENDAGTQEIYKQELLPIAECCYTNNPFSEDPSIDVEVKVGDKVYFEAYGTSNQYNTFRWNMPVKYTRCVQYYNSTRNESVSQIKAVAEGDTVKCTFYDLNGFSGTYRLWFMMKDGRSRIASATISSQHTLNNENRYIETEIVVPQLFSDETGYDNWRFDAAVTKGSSMYPVAVYYLK